MCNPALAPGCLQDTVQKGDYVLVVGKLQPRGEGLTLKAHKVGSVPGVAPDLAKCS